jgi:arginine exporter protein ArgO
MIAKALLTVLIIGGIIFFGFLALMDRENELTNDEQKKKGNQ